MKMVIGFFIGVITVSVLLFGIQFFAPLRAEAEEGGEPSIYDLIPDLDKIYREALVSPLLEAEESIWDEDIARFYHLLLERCSFTEEEGATD